MTTDKLDKLVRELFTMACVWNNINKDWDELFSYEQEQWRDIVRHIEKNLGE